MTRGVKRRDDLTFGPGGVSGTGPVTGATLAKRGRSDDRPTERRLPRLLRGRGPLPSRVRPQGDGCRRRDRPAPGRPEPLREGRGRGQAVGHGRDRRQAVLRLADRRPEEGRSASRSTTRSAPRSTPTGRSPSRRSTSSSPRTSRRILDEIFRGVVSPDGYERFQKQMDDDAGGFGEYHVAVFGTPGSGQFEWEMTGRHVTIRADGDSVANAAFGGPIVYGHGEGDSQEGPARQRLLLPDPEGQRGLQRPSTASSAKSPCCPRPPRRTPSRSRAARASSPAWPSASSRPTRRSSSSRS